MDMEQEIKAAGADKAPRITPADVEGNIASEHYFTGGDGVVGAAAMDWHVDSTEALAEAVDLAANKCPRALSLLTFCTLVLRNGFTVTGESACVSTENFDAEIGRRIARQNAVAKIWPLMGYALRTELARPKLTEADASADLAGLPRPDHPTV